MYWCISFSKHNTTISLYALSWEFNIPPLSATCAIRQINCYKKWQSSSCIIKELIQYIPAMSHYSWTKESRTLERKLDLKNKDIDNKTKNNIKEFHWIRDMLNDSYKAINYNSFYFYYTRNFI
jgi:hypothetical protein